VNELYFGLIPAFAGGMVLGALFFAGLWLSVRKLSHAERPGVLMAFSYVARMTAVLGGLYLLTSGDWQKLAAALVGFVLARILIVRALAYRGRRSIVAVRGEH